MMEMLEIRLFPIPSIYKLLENLNNFISKWQKEAALFRPETASALHRLRQYIYIQLGCLSDMPVGAGAN